MIKWVRKIQGEVLKRIRFRVYEKKRDQRELIKVAQRNFRKYQSMREWGWFVIIQKTRPLIGMPDPNEELRILEEKANATYGVYKEKCDTKVRGRAIPCCVLNFINSLLVALKSLTAGETAR